MPVAIWNGLDVSVSPPKVTAYDNMAIYTGSAVVVEGGGPGGKGLGIVQIYPGLCRRSDWPACSTGTLLAQAVPADYAGDELLTNWTKPAYNPIVEGAQRDPATPWRTSKGEWRLRTFDARVYTAASDADLLAGTWSEVGRAADFIVAECPSFYPLPGPSPGTEREYSRLAAAGALPTHVHKVSGGIRGGVDFWQIGTYREGAPNTTGSFKPTPGWEELYSLRVIDMGHFYASKDAEYPSRAGGPSRRINWGWATVPPKSTQTLPRVITFNAMARTLEQAPAPELEALRGTPQTFLSRTITAKRTEGLGLAPDMLSTSEISLYFEPPSVATRFGVRFTEPQPTGNAPASMECTFDLIPTVIPASPRNVSVSCGSFTDSFRLLPSEKNVSLRVFADVTFIEAYFHGGRVAITQIYPFSSMTQLSIFTSSAPVHVSQMSIYPMRSIWTTSDEVRRQPRIYN
mmetsp:Transcript_10679/g.32897  ORF Transcript_10679/g.32897 Transcript_10679/m.32897 type:complete len:459 (+) Transcript_10679:880-2256(+)